MEARNATSVAAGKKKPAWIHEVRAKSNKVHAKLYPAHATPTLVEEDRDGISFRKFPAPFWDVFWGKQIYTLFRIFLFGFFSKISNTFFGENYSLVRK
jgi:hypothetical protein